MPESTSELPESVRLLRLNGRASDAQFAQNPLPVLTSMGFALADFHRLPTEGLEAKTADEVANARLVVNSGEELPRHYERVSRNTLLEMLDSGPPAASPIVRTHGAPIVSNVLLVDSVASFEDAEHVGADPAERDLAIALRSIAETFAPEATRTFIEAYEAGGGGLPAGPTLDWYALVAAFR